MNTASWLPLAAGGEFTQPRAHLIDNPCTLRSATSDEIERDEWRRRRGSLDKQSLIFTLAVGDAAAVKNELPLSYPNGTRTFELDLAQQQ